MAPIKGGQAKDEQFQESPVIGSFKRARWMASWRLLYRFTKGRVLCWLCLSLFQAPWETFGAAEMAQPLKARFTTKNIRETSGLWGFDTLKGCRESRFHILALRPRTSKEEKGVKKGRGVSGSKHQRNPQTTTTSVLGHPTCWWRLAAWGPGAKPGLLPHLAFLTLYFHCQSCLAWRLSKDSTGFRHSKE